MSFTLRPYQQEAVEAVEATWASGQNKTVGIAATGAGKTVMFAAIIQREMPELRRHGQRVLVLAHRGELLDQAADKIRAECPDLRVGIVKGGRDESRMADVVIASVQTLANAKRREKIGRIGLVIVDECHLFGAPTFMDVLSHYGCLDGLTRTLGVTATLTRMDGGIDKVWDHISFDVPISKLIEEGYLVKPYGLTIQAPKMNLGRTKVTAGDLNMKDVAQAMHESDVFPILAQAYVEHASDRPGVVFTPDVATAEATVDALRAVGITAETITGAHSPKTREAIYSRYNSGATQVLANAMLLTAGWDSPHTSCVVMARPTLNPGLYIQCLDQDTEVLTDGGWRGIDDSLSELRPAAFDLSDGSVHWSPLLNRVERPLGVGETMFALSSPTADIRVTGGHRMVFSARRGDTPWRVKEASELAVRRSDYRIPIAGFQDAPGVPLTDDELRFLGWFLTDGTLNRLNNQITITQAPHQPQIEDLEACLIGCGFKYGKTHKVRNTQFKEDSEIVIFTVSKGAPRGRDSRLRGWGSLEPYVSKDFPRSLEDLTRDQLAVLLEAIHLGDGSKQLGQSWTRRSYHITSANRTFTDRLQSLCVRRGFKCNVAPLTYNDRPAYMLHIKDTPYKAVGGSSQADREHLSEVSTDGGERVWCIETDASTIVTRRNGKVAIVGNCVGRGLRLHPGKDDCLILDLAGAAQRHKLATVNDLDHVEKKPKKPSEPSEKLDGEPGEREPVEDEYLSRKDLRLTEIDLFTLVRKATRSVWLQTNAGVWASAAGDNAWVFAVPSLTEPGWIWGTALGKEFDRKDSGPVELDVALKAAETFRNEWMEERGADDYGQRAARWRKTPASDKQLELVQRWRLTVPENPTKGDVSDAMAKAQATRVLDARFGGHMAQAERLTQAAALVGAG